MAAGSVRAISVLPWLLQEQCADPFTMTVLLSAVMPGVDLADVLYEITSAGATVGLSRGLTPQLNVAGKWIVILTMYLGRIGPLTLGTAVVMRVRNRPGSTTHLGEEDIMIG